MAIERDQFGDLYSAYIGSSSPNGNANSNSNSRASANTGSVTTKKKRRKPIKSCTFCRKRKLRCDQQKPMCSTCLARGLSDCVYVEPAPMRHAVVQAGIDLRASEPDTRLLQKVNELERQLQDVANKVNGSNAQIHIGETSSHSSREPLGGHSSVDHSSVGHSPADAVGHCSPASSGDPTLMFSAASNQDNANPFRDMYSIQSKENGRRIVYGPTAMRTFLASECWGLMGRYKQVRDKVKVARNQLKKNTGYSMLRENGLLEEPETFVNHSLVDTSLVKQLLYVLPSYERIEKVLKLFFATPDLFEFTDAFDKSKVLADFSNGFVAGIPSLSTGERPIVNILPYKKLNYYKVGVVLAIFALVEYGYPSPPAMEKFFVFLSGLSTAKVMYVERVQFTLLRYAFRNSKGLDGGDNSHMIILIDSISCDAISLGLNRDIEKLVMDAEEQLGSVESLQNLWYWVLYLDLTIAFHIGRPLKLNDDNIFQKDFLEDDSRGFYCLLKRFLRLARPIIVSIFDRTAFPDLYKHCDIILSFIEEEFPPISFYTDKKLIHKVNVRETNILCFLLSMLLSLNGLKCLARSPHIFKTKNLSSMSVIDAKTSVVKISLISFALGSNLMAHCVELDKQHFPETLQTDYRMTSPYFSAAMAMLHTLFARAMVMPYVLAYHKLTVFESSGLMFENTNETFSWDLSTLRVPKGRRYPIIPALAMYCDIFDSMSNSKDPQLNRNQRLSRPLCIISTMEKVLRTVVERVLECRATIENSWKVQVQRQTLNSPEKSHSPQMINLGNADLGFSGYFEETPRPNKSSMSAPVVPPVSNSSTPSEATRKAELSVANASPAVSKSPNLLRTEQDSDIINMISDDFWQSYNSRWAELLNSVESGELFSDINI